MENNEKQRENWIDLVKCLAILIVLSNHALLHIPFVSFWGGMFYVPVFFVLAGYTFHFRREKLSQMLDRRANRLLVPYFLYSFLLWIFFLVKNCIWQGEPFSKMLQNFFGIFYARNQIVISSVVNLMSNKTADKVFLMKMLNSPLWFLPALFVTMVVFELFERIKPQNEIRTGFMIAVLVFIAVIFHYFTPLLLPWSLDSVPLFLLFVYGGRLLKKTNILESKQIYCIIIILAVLLGIFGKINTSANYSIGEYGRSITLSVYNAFSSSVICMFVCKETTKLKGTPKRVLDIILYPFYGIGRNTLFILCWHMFVFSILDLVLPRLFPFMGNTAQKVVEVIVTAVGLSLLSVYIEKFKKKHRMLEYAGLKKNEKEEQLAIEMKKTDGDQ